MQGEILFSQVSRAIISLLPVVLPEIHSQCLVFSIQKSLFMTHLKNSIDCLFLDFLLSIGPSLSIYLLVVDLLLFIKTDDTLLKVGLFKDLDTFLLPFHHSK